MGASYIQEIKEQADILDILRPFLSSPPKKQGSNYFALSPFNQEKTPSFSINRQKQIFKCFSSQKGGDVYTFLQEAQGMTFMESVRYVADQIGYQIPEADPKSEGIQKKKAAIYAVLKAASEIFHRQAKDQDFSSKFFEDRKIEDSNIDRFMLGCAYPAWSRLSQELLDKQFSKQVLLESGLAYEREGYVRDRYYRRIIFPIRDHLGRVCGFGGRKTDDDKDQKAKYINSSESIVYDKSSLLYGLYESKDLIRQAAKVYVVEGYTDVISLVKNDYPSVASCGTAITEPQVALMSRFTNNVVLWMDGDSAGIKATARAIPLFLAKGFNVKIATTSASDPDAYFTDQKKDLVEVDWMEWAYQHHVPQDGTPTEQAQGIREVEEYIQQLPFELDQRLYKKKLKELSGIEEQTITIEETKEAISTLKGKQNWTYYCELRERLGLAHSPDFEANDKGELIVSYKNIMDKPVRKAIGGKKQAVIRNITRGEEVFSVYVPHKFRTWRMDNEREKISQPLFIVHGELNAYLLDQMGIFCVGISHRLSFLSKKNSTRLSSTMRQVLEQDFGTVIYLITCT
ncbi:MAG: DNA primase [Bacteroidota bacterium]